MTHDDDLYGILGVGRTASDAQIRAAYRKLARKHHPDVNPGDPGAEERFRKIAAAYEVLSDKEKRQAYDEFGAEALRNGFDPEQARAYRQWREGRTRASQPFGGGFGPESFDLDFDLSDLFGGGFAGAKARSSARGADLRAVVELELAQAIRGTELSLQVPNRQRCDACAGSGTKAGTSPVPCKVCQGSGQRQVARGPMRLVATCTACAGEGQLRTPCPSCRGAGHVQNAEQVTVRIPPGADNGSTLRIAGKGAAGQHGGPDGDLVIETRIRPHPHVRREGLDLFLKLPVSLDEAYNGAQIELPTFQGQVKLTIPPRSQPGARLRLRGKGVRRAAEQGDLYVELDVRLPEHHDEQLAQAIRQTRSAYDQPVREGMRL